MRLSGLLHRTRFELPGVSGVARVDRHTGALLRRLQPGDVAVLDQLDLDRATADALVAAEVVAVVNAARSISGRFPRSRSSARPIRRTWRCCWLTTTERA